jgi:hypothetical protein
MSYKFYNAYNSIATTPKQEILNDLQNVIDQDFENASDVYTILKKDRDTGVFSEITVRLTKPYEIKQMSTIKDDYYKIIFKDNDISSYMGDIFEFSNYRYMVVDVDGDNTPTNSCLVRRCNIQLKFIANNGAVVPILSSTPTVIDAIAHNEFFNPKEDKMVTLPNEQLWVQIPNDADGRLIKYDNNGGTKFLLGNPYQAWACISMDTVTEVRPTVEDTPNSINGIINIKLSNKVASVNNSVDNLILGIAKQRCY